MPGEADRLKKENDELNELLEQSLVDNQRLLDAGRANLNTNLLLQEQVKELEKRVDQLAAAHDAWDLMRDSHTSRLGSLERQVHELTIEVGRLRNDERRWWQR